MNWPKYADYADFADNMQNKGNSFFSLIDIMVIYYGGSIIILDT